MVCIPCIIAPVLLYIWYRFIQPIALKFWNPWAKHEVKMDAANEPQASEDTKPVNETCAVNSSTAALQEEEKKTK
uniref:Putative secreted protein n=1 Tax=Ornithodoros turicata TaxID=34597 RepID=A0A2R5LHC0_9ACAR